MSKNNLTYEKSGVNIKAADKFVNFISSKLKYRNKSGNYKNIGGFGSLSILPKKSQNSYLVACTDGVGTKIEIANDIKKFHNLGIDLVAMSVNDLIVQGAKPLIFLDYIAINKINVSKLKQIITGIIKGCKISGCELAGGETAEMPGTYEKNKFDLAGFAVGIAKKSTVLKKKNIKKNDVVLAIPSNGLHSNGFSLVRYILKKKKININKNKFLKKELIKPTKIYVNEVLKLVEKKLISGCVHITGGGIIENIPRVIPDGYGASIDLSKIRSMPIFKWIKNNGVSDKEMLKTFNCGIGFCLISKKKNLVKIEKHFNNNYKPYPIGKIVTSKKKIFFNEKINWRK